MKSSGGPCQPPPTGSALIQLITNILTLLSLSPPPIAPLSRDGLPLIGCVTASTGSRPNPSPSHSPLLSSPTFKENAEALIRRLSDRQRRPAETEPPRRTATLSTLNTLMEDKRPFHRTRWRWDGTEDWRGMGKGVGGWGWGVGVSRVLRQAAE